MTPEIEILIAAALFASQIFVLSFYVPIRWQQYHVLLFKRYPYEEYPLLHPLPREEVERKLKIFRPLHLTIGAGAILVFISGLVLSPRTLAGLSQMCLFVQLLLPLYVALPLAYRIKQGLSSMPPPSRRSAELRKWRVTDFISPLWIGLSFAGQMLGVAAAAVVYLYRPDMQGVLLIGAMLVALLVASILAFFGDAIVTRADPYMSPADTFRIRQRIYRGLFLGNAVLALWQAYTLLANAGLIQLDVAYGFMLFSVLAQIFGLVLVSRQNRDLSTRDFSVYRSDGGAQVPG